MQISIKAVIDKAGGARQVSARCGIGVRAVYKWIETGALPRTEHSGETDYASILSDMSGGEITRAQILQSMKLARRQKTSVSAE